MSNETQYDLAELLKYIDPASLEYQEWINVGMALKEAGYPCSVWDAWSRNDSRYHAGECFRKWESCWRFGGLTMKPCYGKCDRCVWKKNGGCSEWPREG